MGMDDVEIVGCFGDCLKQRGVGRGRVRTRAAQPQGSRPSRNQLGFGARVPAGKQCDFVAERDQLVCEPCHDPLGPAVKFWRYALSQRSNLRDTHFKNYRRQGQGSLEFQTFKAVCGNRRRYHSNVH